MTDPGQARPAITFLSSSGELGGAEHLLEDILDRLDPDSIQDVICLSDGEFADLLSRRGYEPKVIAGPGRGQIAPAAVRLRRLLRRHVPDVLHANGVRAALVAVLATPGTGVPVVWHKPDCSWDGPLARAIARRCTRVIGISAAVTTTFTGPSAEKVRVVHGGIPSFDVDRRAGRELAIRLTGADERARFVILAGRLCPGKGQLELVEVAPRILEQVPEAQIVLFGGEDPFYRGFGGLLRARVRELGIEPAVSFVSRLEREQSNRLLSGCEVLVAPSAREERGGWREGFPLTVAEALWVETPVVGYASGGLPEVTGECARLVDEGARDSLGDEILNLLRDRELREELAACGARRARDQFGLDTMVDKIRSVYLEAAG